MAQDTGERWLVAARLSRMSKKDRARPELITGIATQDQRSAEWAAGEGHTVVHVTRDRNVSGSVAPWDRPELGPWLTDPAKIAQYDGIVAHEANRLSRDYADLPAMRKWAEQHGKKLYVIKDRLSWPDQRDGMLWAVAAERGYQERQDVIERTTRELDALKRAGKLVGKLPWGYTSAGEKYDHHAGTTAQGDRYAAEMFTLIADGEKLPAVAEWLSGATGRTWHPRTVAVAIRNATYRGEYVMTDSTGRPCVHKCPALVSGELWERAGASLDGRPSVRRGQRCDVKEGAALLSGLVYCGNPACTAGADSPMYKLAPPGRTAVYRCSGRGATRKGCGFMIPVADADALINRVMSGLRRPVLDEIWHPATGNQVRLGEIKRELASLLERELDESAEWAGLRAERRELSAPGAGQDAWTEYVPVLDQAGQPLTYGSRWASSDQAERRAWLRDAGFAVYLARPDMEVPEGEDVPGEMDSRLDVYESGTALLFFRWAGDDDAGLGRALA